MYIDPLEDNYYALLLAIVYPYFLTADEAIYAIKNGVSPMLVTEQTLLDGFRLSSMKREPAHFSEQCGRRYEIVKLLAGVINEANMAMQSLRDYELEKFREKTITYLEYLRKKMEGEKVR